MCPSQKRVGVNVELTNALAQAIVRQKFPACIVEGIELCQGGRISTIYEVHCARPDQDLILKLYPQTFQWKMEKELYVYGLLAQVRDLPIPSILLHDDSKRLAPNNYVLMTRLEGQPLSGVSSELSNEQIRDLYREMGAILARIHQITFDLFGYVTTRVIDPHPTNAAYMRFQFEKKLNEFAGLDGEPPLGRAMAAYVQAHASALADCHTAVLCHNDYHEGNVLVSKEAGRWRVSGIIDVENAVAGDPLFDIAKTDYYSIKGNALKLEGFLQGYGPLPTNWQERIRLYRLYHALELWDWFAYIGNRAVLPGIEADLKRFSRGEDFSDASSL